MGIKNMNQNKKLAAGSFPQNPPHVILLFFGAGKQNRRISTNPHP